MGYPLNRVGLSARDDSTSRAGPDAFLPVLPSCSEVRQWRCLLLTLHHVTRSIQVVQVASQPGCLAYRQHRAVLLLILTIKTPSQPASSESTSNLTRRSVCGELTAFLTDHERVEQAEQSARIHLHRLTHSFTDLSYRLNCPKCPLLYFTGNKNIDCLEMQLMTAEYIIKLHVETPLRT